MAVVDILFDAEYHGPTIIELASILDDITEDPVNVLWTNTKQELRELESHPGINFLLYVQDMHTMGRAVATLGQRIRIEGSALKAGGTALAAPPQQQLQGWRSYIDQVKDINPRHVILKIVADSIRAGKETPAADIINDLFINGGIDPKDADVMLRLKSPRFKRSHG
jgi:hypothetical protein